MNKMSSREIVILMAVLLTICVGVIMFYQEKSGGWPIPNGPPSQQHVDALVRMCRESDERAKVHVAHEYRVIKWWHGSRVPAWYCSFLNKQVYADSLVCIDEVNSDGEVYDTDYIFLGWNGNVPHCITAIWDDRQVPELYRH